MADAQELSVGPFCLAKVGGSDVLSVVVVQEVGQLTHFLQCAVCQLTGSGIGQQCLVIIKIELELTMLYLAVDGDIGATGIFCSEIVASLHVGCQGEDGICLLRVIHLA